jgi:hypothetical protein
VTAVFGRPQALQGVRRDREEAFLADDGIVGIDGIRPVDVRATLVAKAFAMLMLLFPARAVANDPDEFSHERSAK